MLILEAFNHRSWVFDVGLVFFNNVKIVFIMLTFWHIWMAMQMSPDRFLDPYKTMLPCWELQFAWSSQQKEPDCHPQPLRSCLWWSVPQHKSVPATRSKASNGEWGSWDVDARPDPLPRWTRSSHSLSVAGAMSGPGHLHLPVLPRCEQHIHCSLLVLKNVYSKALLISITVYLNWNRFWSRSSSAWLTCWYKLS